MWVDGDGMAFVFLGGYDPVAQCDLDDLWVVDTADLARPRWRSVRRPAGGGAWPAPGWGAASSGPFDRGPQADGGEQLGGATTARCLADVAAAADGQAANGAPDFPIEDYE